MWCLKRFYEGLKGLNFNTTLEMHGTGRVKLNQFMQYESHGVKSVQVRIYSGPYFPEFGLNTGKYGPEITPYLDTFHIMLDLDLIILLSFHICIHNLQID